VLEKENRIQVGGGMLLAPVGGTQLVQIKPQMIQTHQDSETKKFCAKRGFQLISICALNYTHDKHDDNN
jgi:hypothetical protein